MKAKLTVERLIVLTLFVFASVLLWACRELDFYANYSIGPAVLPLICIFFLVLTGIAVWITSTDDKPVLMAVLRTEGAKRCLMLITLTLLFIVSLYFVDFWIPFFVFNVFSFWLVEKHRPLKSLLMSVIWTGFIYVVFVHLLKMNISTL